MNLKFVFCTDKGIKKNFKPDLNSFLFRNGLLLSFPGIAELLFSPLLKVPSGKVSSVRKQMYSNQKATMLLIRYRRYFESEIKEAKSVAFVFSKWYP